MSDLNNLPTTYSPQEAENKWYKIWNEGKYFKPKAGKQKKTYTIIMPPPNVTGQLHMGHALDVTTQDTLIRFKRMKGFETLYLPGMDHAGIATQAVVEKMMAEEEKKSRHDYGREAFVKKIWEWKEKYGGIISEQQRTLGASCDWDYYTFTLDKIPNLAVKKVFVDWYNQGLIYQAERLVNWDPALQSAISDAEVDHIEVQGFFYHILYPIKDSNDFLEIATTRPETMFGDTAVAINPKDERWNKLIGKTAIIPICNRGVPIIGDEYVDLEKGTGCLKVTPGHDFNDFEIGKRHKLPLINILNPEGTLNKEAGEFAGFQCKKARKLVVEKLKELNLFKEEKKHTHQVGHGERSKVIIEPMLSKQWFLNVQQMSKIAVEKVKNNETIFWPKGWENTYFSWLNSPQDWCLSRQLWWGHQIPVFYCKDCKNQWASEEVASTCKKCNSKHIFQDPDVLDTWFSSGLWPFSTLGWPIESAMKEKGFEKFFPTSTLVTGYDIIFFWVARMMMMSIQILDKVPFKDVYVHALVRDKQGRKMSKSLANGIDPIEMVNLYGADAIRFTLAAGSGYNRNLNLDPERISGYRNFINKIWNAFRFIAPHLELAQSELPTISELTHHEKWILAELNQTTKLVNESFEEYRFDDACKTIYSFVYDKFCSWFIELSKNILNSEGHNDKRRRATVLKFSFRQIVALLHPITPYLSEELWSYLKTPAEDLLIAQEFPEYKSELHFQEDQEGMNKFTEVITNIRNLRMSVNIKPKDEVNVQIFLDTKEMEYFSKNSDEIKSQAKIIELKLLKKSESRPAKSIMSATTYCEIFLPLEGIIDLNDQIKRLEKELLKCEQEINKCTAKLNNANFMASAPPEVIFEVKKTAEDNKEKAESIRKNLVGFK